MMTTLEKPHLSPMEGLRPMEQFLNYKKTSRDIFYIDWQQSEPMAQWLIEKPPQLTFEATVHLKQPRKIITVCCHDSLISPSEGRGSPLPAEHIHTDVALLKSSLQKCVRRASSSGEGLQWTDLAIRIGYHLLKLDPNSFLRRLFVIMLEDVCLHLSATNIIWLTCALTKNYQMTHSQVSWLLGVLDMLCHEPYKEFRDYYSHQKPDWSSLWKTSQKAAIPPITRDLVMSIIFRASYGGMLPDLAMFGYYVEMLFNTPNNFKRDSTQFTPLGDAKHPLDLPISELPLCGVDFHCFPHILTLIQNKFPQLNLSTDQIRECLWECNSKTNSRWLSPVDPAIQATWQIIEKETHTIQQFLLFSKRRN